MNDEIKPARRWTLGGYAPGGYMCKCLTCSETFTGDKRAIACLPCAAEAVVARAKASEALVRELAEGLRPLVEAARSLSFGEDWNNGVQAKTLWHRKKLLAALPKAQALILRAEGEEKGSSQSQPVLASNGHGEAEISAAAERLKADLERDPHNLEAADVRVLVGALNGGPAGFLLEYDGEFDTGYRFVKTGDAMRPGWERGARQTPLYTRSAAKRLDGGGE